MGTARRTSAQAPKSKPRFSADHQADRWPNPLLQLEERWLVRDHYEEYRYARPPQPVQMQAHVVLYEASRRVRDKHANALAADIIGLHNELESCLSHLGIFARCARPSSRCGRITAGHGERDCHRRDARRSGNEVAFGSRQYLIKHAPGSAHRRRSDRGPSPVVSSSRRPGHPCRLARQWPRHPDPRHPRAGTALALPPGQCGGSAHMIGMSASYIELTAHATAFLPGPPPLRRGSAQQRRGVAPSAWSALRGGRPSPHAPIDIRARMRQRWG